MPDQHVEAEVISGKDIRSLEASLETLWEKARRVSEVLVQTKEMSVGLRKRVEDLEAVEQRLMKDLVDKEREVERLRQEVLRAQSNGSNILTKEEKEALKARIKDLVTKISSHL